MAILWLYERMCEELVSGEEGTEGCRPGPDELGAVSGTVVITTGKPR